MRVVIILSVVAAIVAEAPYQLPQPGPQAPVFNYPVQQPQRPNIILNSQQSSGGYHYQQPQPRPNYVPQPRPQPQRLPQPVHPMEFPSRNLLTHNHSPAIHNHNLAILNHSPAIHNPNLAILNHNLAILNHSLATHNHSLAIPSHSPNQLTLSHNHPTTILNQHSLSPQPQPIQPFPQPIQPLPQPIFPQPQQSGYSYQQPAAPFIQQSSQALSSYQADSNQYNNAQLSLGQYNSPQQQQTHRDALDDHVVSRVQNIIKDNEHSSAKERGYLSLVSGVSLENAQPSIEISSFVQNSQQAVSQSSGSQSVSTDYGLPNQVDNSVAFIPQNKPAISYGVPN
ncbi:unnamed protein product [Pieris macdunnoughi]|uniref:Uncharacterized protein n=1 Tax=Pieris macdunnoughi TaxID=345717 RepID=A0A821VZ63_9NEOP|nr:unnamed protein product [Pieris macdunnoughi]